MQKEISQRALLQPLDQYAALKSSTLARILSARDVPIQQLDLQLKHLLAPELKGLQQAVALIDQAIDRQQHLLIVGDYDADGATSTALMVLVLRELGATVDYIVPDRFKYGYGLTPAIAELAYQRYQPDVLITVDNGISSHDGVARCHQLGMQVVITDHHLTTKATPLAEAVVNPNQLGCTFASKSLVGVGVAFYVLACLATHRKKLGKSSCHLAQYLDLVALGTVADVGKFDFNNRIFIQAGLQRIRKRQCRPGILALLALTNKTPEQLQSRDLGFIIAPRINAAGRMDTMQIGIECLLAEDMATADEIAKKLDQLNSDRRQIEQQMREQAFDDLEKIQNNSSTELDQAKAIVLFEPHWHQGVIGIVAGRLREHFHLPSIVFAPDDNPELIKGSARSITGIHIRDCIESVAQDAPHVVKYFGGHAAAAGLTIEKKYFDEFKQCFLNKISSYQPTLFQAKIFTDGELAIDEFSLDFLARIEQLEPFGQGFEAPVFEGIFTVQDYQWLKDEHLKIKILLPNQQVVSAIGFYFREKLTHMQISPTVRMVFTLDKNYFREAWQLQLTMLYLQNLD